MNGKDERAKILERIKKLMALADDRGAAEENEPVDEARLICA